MPSIVIHTSDGTKLAGRFDRRALIGRKAFNGVQIDEPQASRLHAWIDRDNSGFYIADAASRSGTTVDGHLIVEPTPLTDGEEIRIGSTVLTFHESDELPDDALAFEVSEEGTNPNWKDDGVLLHCECGAQHWMAKKLSGKLHCAHCHRDVATSAKTIRPVNPADAKANQTDASPTNETLVAEAEAANEALPEHFPHPHPTEARAVCSVCQTDIAAGEETERCSACGQIYHRECWLENRGCAAYGCEQVGALEPGREENIPAAEAQ